MKKIIALGAICGLTLNTSILMADRIRMGIKNNTKKSILISSVKFKNPDEITGQVRVSPYDPSIFDFEPENEQLVLSEDFTFSKDSLDSGYLPLK